MALCTLIKVHVLAEVKATLFERLVSPAHLRRWNKLLLDNHYSVFANTVYKQERCFARFRATQHSAIHWWDAYISATLRR
jgi:hypothetical protein